MNRAGGHLSEELLAALADQIGPVRHYSSDMGSVNHPAVRLVRMPKYRRTTLPSRFLSWCSFWIVALRRVLCERGLSVST